MRFFRPDYMFYRLTEITPEFLEKAGIRALVLDVDNTLSTHHGQEPVEGLDDWIKLMQKNGIKLLIASNAFSKRVAPFAEKIGLSYQSTSLKPLPFAYFRAARRLGEKRRHIAIVGDQVFTDIIGGSVSGVKTILVTPIMADKFVRRRKLEDKLIKNRPKESGAGGYGS